MYLDVSSNIPYSTGLGPGKSWCRCRGLGLVGVLFADGLWPGGCGRPETRDPVVRKRGWEIPHQNIIYMKYIYIYMVDRGSSIGYKNHF